MMSYEFTKINASDTIVFDKKDIELFFHNKCDKYDYLTAVGCGVLSGCIDVFLVGAPSDSTLGKWTDTQADNFVKFFARKQGWKPRVGNEDNVKSAIGFLENGTIKSRKNGFNGYKINYDQQHNAAAGGHVPGMTTKNHHLKSLAHSPSIIGLFFSLLNQFTSTSTFISGGSLITIKTDTFELQGGNFISKLFCGVANWFGHIISDMAGSSGAKSRGSGVPIPFFELFQLCDFGEFTVKGTSGKMFKNDLATLATKVFQNGYDLRFGVAMAIPVMLNELLVRLIWALKRKFYHKMPLNECIPLVKHQNLRTMLIVAHGTLCLIDVADAGIRSGGCALTFMLQINLIAWYRLLVLVLKEVFIRLGIAANVQQYLESYMIANEQLREYIAELEKIDMQKFREEAILYENMANSLTAAMDDESLNIILIEQTKTFGLDVPWGDDWDDWAGATDRPFILD